MRETQSHTLSNTTTQNLENMEDFNLFWDLYPGDPEWSHERENCERVWYGMQQNWRDNLVQQLQQGKRWRPIDKEHPERNNPIWYLRNYQGEMVPVELPYYRQGTAAFGKWHDANRSSGTPMSLFRYEGALAYCLTSDSEKMKAAGAEWIRDNA